MKGYIDVLTLCMLFSTTSDAATVRTNADDTDRLLAMPNRPFVITCSVDHSDMPSAVVVSWYKSVEGGARVKLKSTKRVQTNGSRLLVTEPSAMDDPGNYTCVFAATAADGQLEATVQVIANVTVNMPGVSLRKVEGEDLAMRCTLRGNPWPTVHWTKDGGPIADVIQDASSRLTLKADDMGFPNALLTLTGLRRPDDAGDYCCHAESVANAAVGCTIVRVKDKYAALWPAIGILAELLLLAAIIFFCETRKVKSGADEIDLDNGDDKAKSQGQSAGDVRQRK